MLQSCLNPSVSLTYTLIISDEEKDPNIIYSKNRYEFLHYKKNSNGDFGLARILNNLDSSGQVSNNPTSNKLASSSLNYNNLASSVQDSENKSLQKINGGEEKIDSLFLIIKNNKKSDDIQLFMETIIKKISLAVKNGVFGVNINTVDFYTDLKAISIIIDEYADPPKPDIIVYFMNFFRAKNIFFRRGFDKTYKDKNIYIIQKKHQSIQLKNMNISSSSIQKRPKKKDDKKKNGDDFDLDDNNKNFSSSSSSYSKRMKNDDNDNDYDNFNRGNEEYYDDFGKSKSSNSGVGKVYYAETFALISMIKNFKGDLELTRFYGLRDYGALYNCCCLGHRSICVFGDKNHGHDFRLYNNLLLMILEFGLCENTKNIKICPYFSSIEFFPKMGFIEEFLKDLICEKTLDTGVISKPENIEEFNQCLEIILKKLDIEYFKSKNNNNNNNGLSMDILDFSKNDVSSSSSSSSSSKKESSIGSILKPIPLCLGDAQRILHMYIAQKKGVSIVSVPTSSSTNQQKEKKDVDVITIVNEGESSSSSSSSLSDNVPPIQIVPKHVIASTTDDSKKNDSKKLKVKRANITREDFVKINKYLRNIKIECDPDIYDRSSRYVKEIMEEDSGIRNINSSMRTSAMVDIPFPIKSKEAIIIPQVDSNPKEIGGFIKFLQKPFLKIMEIKKIIINIRDSDKNDIFESIMSIIEENRSSIKTLDIRSNIFDDAYDNFEIFLEYLRGSEEINEIIIRFEVPDNIIDKLIEFIGSSSLKILKLKYNNNIQEKKFKDGIKKALESEDRQISLQSNTKSAAKGSYP